MKARTFNFVRERLPYDLNTPKVLDTIFIIFNRYQIQELTTVFLFCYFFSDKLNCSRAYTILFVAFDLEENQQDNAQCEKCSDCCSACPGITCGSYGFVQNFTRYLNSTGASFQGAFILDTVMNYNNTPNSQKLPDSFNENFPEISQSMKMNKNRGNFLAVIGRSSNDGQLIRNISMAFDTDGESQIYK